MADFVIHFRRVRDGLGDLVAKKAAVALTEAMHQAFHGRFGHPQRLRQRRIGDIFALRPQARAQRFKSAQFSLTFAFLPQASQRLFDDGRRPAQIEKTLGGPGFQRLRRHRELRRRFSHPIIPGDELDIAAPLAGVPFLRGIVQEVPERLEQERPEPAAGGIGVLEPVTFQHHNEKILGEILRVLRGVTAPADERKDGTPIEPAEFRKGLVRLLLVASEIGRGEDETPPCRREVSSFATTFRGDRWGSRPRMMVFQFMLYKPNPT